MSEPDAFSADERIRLIVSGLGVGVWDRDLGSGRSLWDAQMYRLRGLEPDDPRPIDTIRLETIHPDDLPRIESARADFYVNGDEVQESFRVILPDGSLRWLGSRACIVRNGRGQAVRMYGINWDVTDRWNRDAANRERAQAEAANRAKSLFVARLSHELRTPLNAVLGFARLLTADRSGTLQSSQLERLGLIRDAGEHLLALIDDSLDLAMIEAGTLPIADELVELDVEASRARRWVEAQAAGAGIDLQVDRLEGRVSGDCRRIRQIFVNLLTNAIKYSARGGTVWLRTVRDGAPDLVWIEIGDTGVGMDAAQLERLFTPFDRLGADANRIEGSGIGLSLVAHLIERIGAVLQVSSVPGQGTVFRIGFRGSDARSRGAAAGGAYGSTRGAGARPAHLAADPPRPRNLRPFAFEVLMGPGTVAPAPIDVLYIEDDPASQLLMQALLERRTGLRILKATRGHSGFAMARLRRPGLILLDVHLPDADGFEVLSWLRADLALSDTVVIAVSATPASELIVEALAAGFDDCWTKPLDIERFDDDLDRWLGRADRVRARP